MAGPLDVVVSLILNLTHTPDAQDLKLKLSMKSWKMMIKNSATKL